MGINDRSWQEIEQDEVVQEIRRRVKRRLNSVWQGKLVSAFNHYVSRKKRGDYSYMVEDWDAFELERDRERLRELEKQGIEGEVKYMTKKVSIELTKEYNKVVVGVDDILEVDDFITAKEFAWNEAIDLINRIPDGGFGKTTPKSQTPNQYTKQTYPQRSDKPRPQQGYVTAGDINVPFTITDGQKGVAVKRIKKGDITLEQVNATKTYEEFQQVVFGR